jgi:LDH2 family malate/lactate/ureidoglycolate dehydrogenase
MAILRLLTKSKYQSTKPRTCVRKKVLQAAGYTHEQAATITDHLVDAELRGHPFAGLARALSIIEQLKDSGMEADIDIEVTRSGPAYAHVDGHNAVGYLVARQATQFAIDKDCWCISCRRKWAMVYW